MGAKELQEAAAENPDDPWLHGLLGLCLSQMEKHEAAIASAKRAVEAAPDLDYGYYVLGLVLAERGQLKEARAAAESAIELDPNDAPNFGLLAKIEFLSDNWQAAVQAADQGLQRDPTEDVCRHFRSLALVKLGRREDAELEVSSLLADNPADPHTHEARGWLKLEQNEPAKAEEHFLESLRLSPNNTSAREGLANALKARHFVFGLALRFLLWSDRFRAWTIWIAAIVFFVGLAQLRKLAATSPVLFWPVWVLDIAANILIVSLIAAQPLFNLVLRLSPRTRIALSPDQIRASNWHLLCLLAALGMGLLAAWKGDRQMRTLGFATVMLTLAVTNTFAASAGWVRQRMIAVALLAAFLIPLSFLVFLFSLFFLLKFRVNTSPFIKLGLFYLPLTSVLLSAFSDEIAGFLERRKPDRN